MVCTKFKIRTLNDQETNRFNVQFSGNQGQADSNGASLAFVRCSKARNFWRKKNNRLATGNFAVQFIFHSQNITRQNVIRLEESNGTKVTCFRQSFDAARIVRKPLPMQGPKVPSEC